MKTESIKFTKKRGRKFETLEEATMSVLNPTASERQYEDKGVEFQFSKYFSSNDGNDSFSFLKRVFNTFKTLDLRAASKIEEAWNSVYEYEARVPDRKSHRPLSYDDWASDTGPAPVNLLGDKLLFRTFNDVIGDFANGKYNSKYGYDIKNGTAYTGDIADAYLDYFYGPGFNEYYVDALIDRAKGEQEYAMGQARKERDEMSYDYRV